MRRKVQAMVKDVDHVLVPGDQLRVISAADLMFVDAYVKLTTRAGRWLEDALVVMKAPMFSYKLFVTLATDLKRWNETCVPCYVPLLARRFGVSQATVHSVRKALIDADVMRKIQKNIVLLNPYLVFAGANKEWSAARKRWDEGIVACSRIAVVVEQLMEMERVYEEED